MQNAVPYGMTSVKGNCLTDSKIASADKIETIKSLSCFVREKKSLVVFRDLLISVLVPSARS